MAAYQVVKCKGVANLLCESNEGGISIVTAKHVILMCKNSAEHEWIGFSVLHTFKMRVCKCQNVVSCGHAQHKCVPRYNGFVRK